MMLSLNGVSYHVTVAGSGPSLLLLHGFTGSSASWERFIPRLSAVRRTVAVDLLGHGQTGAPAYPDRYRVDHAAADLIALLDTLQIECTDLLGYSMGGRLALHLALRYPERVRTLILESASPGIEDAAERAARVQSDEALADRIEREGVAAFVDYWETLPLFAGLRHLPLSERTRLRRQRLAHTPHGLANSLRGFGAGVPEPLWEQIAALRAPSFIAGEQDAKYVTIAHRMAAMVPSGRLAIIPESGHTIHLEQPEQFLHSVLHALQHDLFVYR